MPFTLNRVSLLGTLGEDAETRTTTNNKSVTSFSVATERSYKVGDEWKKETDWHNIVAWELSDFILGKLKKGNKVYIDGEIVYRSYEKDGEKKYITEIKTSSQFIIPLEKNENISNSVRSIGGVEEDDKNLPF